MKPHNSSFKKIGAQLTSDFEAIKSGALREDILELLHIKKNREAIAKTILLVLGGVFSFISFAGMMIGYVRAYNRFMRPKEILPRLYNLPLIVKISMALGIVFIWVVIIGVLGLFVSLELLAPSLGNVVVAFLGTNIFLSALVYAAFRKWQISVWNLIMSLDKNGTARYATTEDLLDYTADTGLFIGGPYAFNDKGHCLLVCGTRGGKSQNILMANALYLYNYQGSMVYIDPKGETAAVCANYLRKMGKNVVILNAWDLLPGAIPDKTTYNPLSLLSDKTSDHLIDDVTLIAELLVPLSGQQDHNAFFTDSARNMIAGLLLHLVTTSKVKDPTLSILWEWLRYSGAQWDNLLADMTESKDPINGHAIRMAASEIAKQTESPETFASIISNALSATSFLKSLALQKSLVSGGLDPYSIADGNTVVFLVMPFDKLKSHANYLRVVITTMLRAVVRKPKKKVTFICDEAFNLGYISEFETALSGYAGFNVSMWLVYQDIPQIGATYGVKWESVMANCTIRQFMSVKDYATMDYVSALMGEKTRVVYRQDLFGNVTQSDVSPRRLATSNEVMRISQKNIIMFTGENPVTVVPKIPYYNMPRLKDKNGKNLYDPNPYIENSL